MNLPPELIEASRVSLRRVVPNDADSLFAIAVDPEVMQFMDWAMPSDAASVRAVLEGAHVDWDAGLEHQWVILERRSGHVAGTISFRPQVPAADFGYFLARGHWGKGLAFDAATAILGWLTAQPEIVRVSATADVDNLRSRRLLERLGLRLERVMRAATVRPNMGFQPRDTAVYSLSTAVE